MKRGVTTLLSVASSLVLATGSYALTAENPYKSIVERNVFGLKPPPPPKGVEDEAAKPPPNVFLTGITTLMGTKRALIKTTPPPGMKPGEKGVEENFMLTEGQRDGDVEVLQIDERKGMVRIRLAGKDMDLDFERNGVKISAAAAAPMPGSTPTPSPLPGFPFRPAGAPSPVPPPGATPLGASSGTYNSAGTLSPSYGRSVRLGGPGGMTGMGGNAMPIPVSAGSPSFSTPGGTLNFSGGSSQQAPVMRDPREGMSPEQVEALTMLNKVKMQQEGDPRANLLPPLPGEPSANMLTPTPGAQSQQMPRMPGMPQVPMPGHPPMPQ